MGSPMRTRTDPLHLGALSPQLRVYYYCYDYVWQPRQQRHGIYFIAGLNLWPLSGMKKLKIDYDQTGADVNFLDGPPNLELPLAAIGNWQLATGNWRVAFPYGPDAHPCLIKRKSFCFATWRCV